MKRFRIEVSRFLLGHRCEFSSILLISVDVITTERMRKREREYKQTSFFYVIVYICKKKITIVFSIQVPPDEFPETSIRIQAENYTDSAFVSLISIYIFHAVGCILVWHIL